MTAGAIGVDIATRIAPRCCRGLCAPAIGIDVAARIDLGLDAATIRIDMATCIAPEARNEAPSLNQ